MSTFYSARNSKNNRNAGLDGRDVKLIRSHNGMVYFQCTKDDGLTVNYYCSESLFAKEFHQSVNKQGETNSSDEIDFTKLSFSKYPH